MSDPPAEGGTGPEVAAPDLAGTETLCPDLLQTFCAVAGSYLGPVRGFLSKLEPGLDPREQLPSLLPQVEQVAGAADAMGLAPVAEDFRRLLGLLRREVEGGGATLSPGGLESLLTLRTSLVRFLPDDDPRDPDQEVVLRHLLSRMPGLDPDGADRVRAAGLSGLDLLAGARPGEVAAVAGLSVDLCAPMIRMAADHVRARERARYPSEWASALAAARRALERDLGGGLNGGAFRDPALTALRVELLLVEMGEEAVLHGLEGAPLDRWPDRLRELELRVIRPSREEVMARFGAGHALDHLDLRGLDLAGVHLARADLAGTDLGGADLRGADLSRTILIHASLRKARLSGAFLDGARCRHARLEGADLTGASLRGVDLVGAHLEGVRLDGADLEGAFGKIAARAEATRSTLRPPSARKPPGRSNPGWVVGIVLALAVLFGALLWVGRAAVPGAPPPGSRDVVGRAGPETSDTTPAPVRERPAPSTHAKPAAPRTASRAPTHTEPLARSKPPGKPKVVRSPPKSTKSGSTARSAPVPSVSARPETPGFVFADPVLDDCVRRAVGRPTGPLDPAAVEALTRLDCSSPGSSGTDVVRLEGIEALRNLVHLDLSFNRVVDISPVAGLGRLRTLNLRGNRITDITPVVSLPLECEVDLWQNPVADIAPLLERSRRGRGGGNRRP